MATVSITIPDAQLTRVVNALCDAAGLSRSSANARAAIIEHIKRTVINVERGVAEHAALAAVTPPSDPGLS